MSSSLNEILLTKIRDLLQKEPLSTTTATDAILALTDWDTSLVDQVSDALIAAPPTEANIHNLYYWGRLVFHRMKELNGGVKIERLYGLAYITDLMFKYISRPTKIPFKYWEDITPQMLEQIRHFRNQSKTYDEFFEQDLKADFLSRKDNWLASNPETAAIYERWDHENMFG